MAARVQPQAAEDVSAAARCGLLSHHGPSKEQTLYPNVSMVEVARLATGKGNYGSRAIGRHCLSGQVMKRCGVVRSVIPAGVACDGQSRSGFMGTVRPGSPGERSTWRPFSAWPSLISTFLRCFTSM